MSAFTSVPFTKMHGLGNDFIVLDDRDPRLAQLGVKLADHVNPEFAQRICDRRFGVGADQILWIRKPQQPAQADFRMEILNSDGSVAEMCGNGIRAVALYLQRRGLATGKQTRIETLAGVRVVEIVGLKGDQVTVDMGVPQLGGGFGAIGEGESIEAAGRAFRFFEVSMGNPHAVFFGEDQARLPEWGPALERHPRFPKRTNVEFVHVENPGSIRVRVWERGAGLTLACGTGACGAAVASLATGRAKSPVQVHLPGGALEIAWEGPGKPVMMTGPAEEVFEGVYQLR